MKETENSRTGSTGPATGAAADGASRAPATGTATAGEFPLRPATPPPAPPRIPPPPAIEPVPDAPASAATSSRAPAGLMGHLRVVPWPDPVLERAGHDPRSPYVERFWLAVLGPTATWLVRRLAAELDHAPQGYTLDLATSARSLGLGTKGGRHTPFLHSVERTCEFGLSRYLSTDVLAVRRRLPPLSRHQVARLPQPLREEHHRWMTTRPEVPDPAVVRDRARRLALSLVELGEDREATERQLHRWRFHPALAHEVTEWALAHHTAQQGAPPSDPGAA